MQGCERSKGMSKSKTGLLKPRSGGTEIGMDWGGSGWVGHIVKCWNSNSTGARGYVKEGWELAPMGSFDVEQGGH